MGGPLTKFVENCYTHILTWEMKPPSSQSLFVRKYSIGFILPLFLTYLLLLPFNDFAHVGVYGET